jgi:sulfhydrogenase subunit gamma (sulfur reductase)
VSNPSRSGASEPVNVFVPMEAEILRAVKHTATEKLFTLRLKHGARMEYEPGQIVELSRFGYGEIPIGFASSPTRRDSFDLVIRAVGRVSQAIHACEKGDSLWVRGPLGRGFDLSRLRNRDILVVAAGIGLCPTRSLIEYIVERRSEFGAFTLFYGTRTPQDQLFPEDLAHWRASPEVDFHETVDRADADWKGNVGVITTLFARTPISPETRVAVCGPPVMYRFVIRELDRIGIPHSHVYVDLERRMKCGLGRCGHCQINDKYVCTDGPVFAYSEIENLEEALQ